MDNKWMISEVSSLSADDGCQQQIAEIDGCMLPIITVREDSGDKRKKKVLHDGCYK